MPALVSWKRSGVCPKDATKLEPIEQVPVATLADDPFVGHKVAGKYELRRVVADGGMGRVYEGRQLDPERRVAVKILHASAEDGVNIERFKREAETSQSLDHSHIVEVFDFAEEKPAPGRKDGAWFLVMEYLDGDELRTVLTRQKTIPMPRAIRIMSQTAIALDGAHARGAVHRDLKPDNIFLVRRREGDLVKVLDFGSVKFTKGQDKGAKLTVMGTTIGSPFYMSPEQAKGVPDLDHRADVWALGAIVYEMAVGQVPFAAPNGPQILFKILSEEPMPPSFTSDSAPTELDDFIVKALNKKRELRYQSCGELADALGRWIRLGGTLTSIGPMVRAGPCGRIAAKRCGRTAAAGADTDATDGDANGGDGSTRAELRFSADAAGRGGLPADQEGPDGAVLRDHRRVGSARRTRRVRGDAVERLVASGALCLTRR